MHNLDWFILISTILFIVIYGAIKTRKNRNINSFLKGDNSSNWFTIGISVMATQASAITFLSTPGQAYNDGMGFLQFYLGLPLAMIIICIVFVPIYHKLKVFTAYEFLEKRFDKKTRTLGAILFLVQRGLAAGMILALRYSYVKGNNFSKTKVTSAYISCRPSKARISVTSSAYSRSPPTGNPRANLVTRTPPPDSF